MGTEGYAPPLDPKYGDFITPEQHIPATGMPGVDWETCMTMNTTWGYSEHDHAWKSDETLIRNLIDIASKGGNYLLNIGPKGDGSVPEESVAVDAGDRRVDEGQRRIDLRHDAPARSRTCRGAAARRKGSTLYLHVFDWPKDGKLVVPGLRNARQERAPAGGRRRHDRAARAGRGAHAARRPARSDRDRHRARARRAAQRGGRRGRRPLRARQERG